jgi:hypothetical protein
LLKENEQIRIISDKTMQDNISKDGWVMLKILLGMRYPAGKIKSAAMREYILKLAEENGRDYERVVELLLRDYAPAKYEAVLKKLAPNDEFISDEEVARNNVSDAKKVTQAIPQSESLKDTREKLNKVIVFVKIANEAAEKANTTDEIEARTTTSPRFTASNDPRVKGCVRGDETLQVRAVKYAELLMETPD